MGRHICTSRTADLSPLGNERQHEFIEISEALGDEQLLAYFAEPVMLENREKIDWYTDQKGPSESYKNLMSADQLKVRSKLQELVCTLNLKAKNASSVEKSIILKNIQSIPDEDSILVVGDQIVLVNWSYKKRSHRQKNLTIGEFSNETMKEETPTVELVNVEKKSINDNKSYEIEDNSAAEKNEKPKVEEKTKKDSLIENHTNPAAEISHINIWEQNWFWAVIFLCLLVLLVLLLKDACGVNGLWFLDFCVD
jgi:hypothetical protein